VWKVAAKHKTKIMTPYGPRTCFQAGIARNSRTPLVARFGGIPLKRQKTATLVDCQPPCRSTPTGSLTAFGSSSAKFCRRAADLVAGCRPGSWQVRREQRLRSDRLERGRQFRPGSDVFVTRISMSLSVSLMGSRRMKAKTLVSAR
jgi:hypothetical protein